MTDCEALMMGAKLLTYCKRIYRTLLWDDYDVRRTEAYQICSEGTFVMRVNLPTPTSLWQHVSNNLRVGGFDNSSLIEGCLESYVLPVTDPEVLAYGK